ncbi:MAG: hypothetical protein H7Z41_10740 [Cytophagales bacterium]|nr:hypothetical protein [Armatimonadota bacterium]
MPLYTEIEEPEFADGEARHRWFVNVVLADYGELESAPKDTEVPNELNWLLLVPPDRRYDFEDVECGMVYLSPDGAYTATVWDASGEDDEPWGVFWVDDFGPRLLPEYSVFREEATEEEREAVLRRAADEIPDRAERGEWTRTGTPVAVPDWLMTELSEDDGNEQE